MMDFFTSPILHAAGASIGGVLMTAVGYEWKIRRNENVRRKKKTKDWYRETRELVVESIITAKKHIRYGNINYDSLTSEFDELSQKIATHASNAPNSVDEVILSDLAKFAGMCSAIAGIAELREGESGTEYVEAIFENSDNDSDIELNQIIEWFNATFSDEIEEYSYEGNIVKDEDAADVFIDGLNRLFSEQGNLDIDEFPIDIAKEAFDDEFLHDASNEALIMIVEEVIINMAEKIYREADGKIR